MIEKWEFRNWQRSVFISRPFHTQQSVMGIIFVWDMCVRGKWGHCCFLLCFFFLGQGVFFDQKHFFSIIKSMGRAGFVVIKKNRKTDITCVFLSMNFLTSKICMFCIRGHQIIVCLFLFFLQNSLAWRWICALTEAQAAINWSFDPYFGVTWQ